jgi:hypothetical protein
MGITDEEAAEWRRNIADFGGSVRDGWILRLLDEREQLSLRLIGLRKMYQQCSEERQRAEADLNDVMRDDVARLRLAAENAALRKQVDAWQESDHVLVAQLAALRRVLVNISHSASGPGWASPAAVELREMAKRAVTPDTIGADVWAVVGAAAAFIQKNGVFTAEDGGLGVRMADDRDLRAALNRLREKGLL